MISTPVLVKNYEDDDGLHFVLKDIHVSIANAVRRTILSDIPIVVIRTETNSINKCNITINNSRFHNEIVKQRLSCIPIHTKDLEDFPKKYRLIVNVKNETPHELRWVTTDDFKLQDKENEQFVDDTEVRKIFPHNEITNQPIDFLRLRPGIGNTNGEHINLTAEFSVSNAKENGMFNVVSKCSFHNVIDADTRENVWASLLQGFKNENRTQEEIEFERKNFMHLDAYRCYKTDENGDPNEFDFIVKTLGIYSNIDIVYNACDILATRFKQFIQEIQSQIVPIHKMEDTRNMGYTSVTVSTIDNAYDVILEDEDYTMGCLLQHFIYTMFYNSTDDDNLKFIGFKKYHPHDTYSVIRMAFSNEKTALLLTKQYLVQVSTEIYKIFEKIRDKFKE